MNAAQKKKALLHLAGLTGAIALGLTACGGSGDTDRPNTPAPPSGTAPAPDPVPTPPAPAPPAPSPPAPAPAPGTDGCGQTPPTTTNMLVTELKDADGTPRQFKLIVSPGYNRNQRAPLVIAFHGRGGRISDSESFQYQTAIANAGDAGIVLLPQGLDIPGGWGFGWTESCNGNDMAFVDAMINYAAKNFCVDKSRVFTTGFSWGSDMTNATACCMGAKLKGVAPFSGPEGMKASCPTPAASFPAARYLYGDADTAYGSNSLAQHASTVATYASKLSCGTSTTITEPSYCKSYASCRTPLTECKVPGGGHIAPDLTQAAYTWKFWKAVP